MINFCSFPKLRGLCQRTLQRKRAIPSRQSLRPALRGRYYGARVKILSTCVTYHFNELLRGPVAFPRGCGTEGSFFLGLCRADHNSVNRPREYARHFWVSRGDGK